MVIGDSMAGVRIDPGTSVRGTGKSVAGSLHAGHPGRLLVSAAQEPGGRQRPDARARGDVLLSRRSADHAGQVNSPLLLDRVARDDEPELDRDVRRASPRDGLAEVHRLARAVYQFDRTRIWLEPRLTRAPLRADAGDARRVARHHQQRGVRARQAAHVRGVRSAGSPKSRCWISMPRSADRCCRRSSGSAREPASGLAFVRVQRRPRPRRSAATVRGADRVRRRSCSVSGGATAPTSTTIAAMPRSTAGDLCGRRSPEA